MGKTRAKSRKVGRATKGQGVNSTERQWYDLDGLTRYAPVSRRTLLTWIYAGLLTAFKVGGKWYIRRRDFDAWLENHRFN